MPTLATFNANNFFLRYKFSKTYPGDLSKKSAREAASISMGYIPENNFGDHRSKSFIVWDPLRRDLAKFALSEPDDQLPDLLCLQEVENMDALRVLNKRHLGNHYPYAMLIDGYDPRNIDVALLSRFPIIDLRSHVDDEDSDGARILSRDCLEASVRLPSGEPLTLLINHFKSKYVDAKNQTTAQIRAKALAGHKKRERQAKYVLKLVKERFKGEQDTALYAVVGDFNDTEQSPWIKPLLNSSYLTDVVAKTQPPENRWTYYWRSERKVQQIDFVLCSRALAARVTKSHIERAGLPHTGLSKRTGEPLPSNVKLVHFEDDGVTPAPTKVKPTTEIPFPKQRYVDILDDKNVNVSDHCPVKVWFS